ncbi:MAG: hypothetical protein WCJ39_03145 [bacterium]
MLSFSWRKTSLLSPYVSISEALFQKFSLSAVKEHRRRWVLVIVFALSIIYYLYGFQLSFIPYSTAWDANHAYMYVPKVLAENG